MAGIRLVHCLPEEQERLRLAVAAASRRLTNGVCGLPGLDLLRHAMVASLTGFRSLTIRCSECEGLPADGYSVGRGTGQITLCRSVLSGDQDRVNAVLFHELIHACGGDELDGEGLECHCFPDGIATRPDTGDYRLFRRLPLRSGYHVGQYLLWNPVSGQVFVRAPGDRPGAALNVRFDRPLR